MKKYLFPLLLLTVALIAAFLMIVTYESDYLMRVEEMSLFLDTPLFLSQQLVVAGGMLSYVGAWFTQFLYVPWQGVLIICLLCALLMVLMQQAFRLPLSWTPLLLVPLVAVLLSEFMLGYWIYLIKLRGYFFALALGSGVALLDVWGYRLLTRRPWWLRALWIVLSGTVLYPLVGCYGLAALLLMVAMEWRFSEAAASRKAALTALAVLVMIAVPLLCYRYVYDQTPLGLIWWCGLPLFAQGEEQYLIYYMPYLLMICVCLLAIFLPNIRRYWLSTLAGGLIVAALVFTCHHYWYKDENFHKEIQMAACVEQCNWQGVMDVAATVSNPTRQIVLYKYLALFKMGRIGEEMYDLPDDGVLPNCPAVIHLVQTGGQQLYLQYGIPNFCYRWCVEDCVEYGWRVKDLRLMLRCALLSKEWSLARKYIDLLSHTRNHAEWARQYLPMIGHPDQIAKHGELGPITRVMGSTSVLASDQSLIEKFLLTLLSGLQTDDPVGTELALMSAVQLKDIPSFWRAFNQYALAHPDIHMPRIYQEAAYLYGHLEHDIDISNMPFDQSVIDSYQNFMQRGQQYPNMSVEQLHDILYPEYGKTFYFNYFLVRGLKTY